MSATYEPPKQSIHIYLVNVQKIAFILPSAQLKLGTPAQSAPTFFPSVKVRISCLPAIMPKKISPAKLIRSVKRMIKFLERKRPAISKVVLPCINIAPDISKFSKPKLSIS